MQRFIGFIGVTGSFYKLADPLQEEQLGQRGGYLVTSGHSFALTYSSSLIALSLQTPVVMIVSQTPILPVVLSLAAFEWDQMKMVICF